jgi:hypothetical protein
LPVIKWLDTETIHRPEQRLCPPIKNDKRKHSVQSLEHFSTPLEIGFKQSFGIALPAPSFGRSTKFAPQFKVIVYLAIKDNDCASTTGGHRLRPRLGQFDDGQANVTHPALALRITPLTTRVRPTVLDPCKSKRSRPIPLVVIDRNATHLLVFLSISTRIPSTAWIGSHFIEFFLLIPLISSHANRNAFTFIDSRRLSERPRCDLVTAPPPQNRTIRSKEALVRKLD